MKDQRRNIVIPVLILFILIISPAILFAQDIKLTDSPIATAINKYWHYRDRLKYFVVPNGTYCGGLVGGIRNRRSYSQDETVAGATNMDFEEEAVYLGYYLGVLATEYKLLSDQNANYNKTLTDLFYALNAYIENMDKCEYECYPSNDIYNSDFFDGFFVRSHITMDGLYSPIGDNGDVIQQLPPSFDYFMRTDNHSQTLNENLIFWDNHFHDDNNGIGFYGLEPGQPGFIQSVTPSGWKGCEEMSKDQVIGILTGLALVVHLVPSGLPVYKTDGTLVTNFDLHNKAKDIADKIIKYIAWGYSSLTSTCAPDSWNIINPACENVTNGHNCETLEDGFVSAIIKITGNPASDYNHPEDNLEFEQGSWLSLDNSAKWMYCSLAAIGDKGTPGNIGTVADENYRDWAPFYLLLWSVIHDDFSNDNVQDILPEAITLIGGAPCEGPYNYDGVPNAQDCGTHFAPNGWCTSYRWHCDNNEQWGRIQAQNQGNYNGLDYMLLLNLYCIVKGYSAEYNTRPLNGLEFPVYTGFFPANIVGDATYPVFVASADNIESDAKFYNYVSNVPVIHTPAVGTYKAKNSITLKPGFKVEAGAYFHGIIEDVTCYDIWTSWKQTHPDNNNINVVANDSIKLNLLPYEKDSLSVYPNPNDGNMSVDYNLNESEAGTFILYDLLGKELINFQLYSGKNIFTITDKNLEKGIYTYRAFAGNKQIASDKIVVIK
jgi:hypothetical protein